MWWVQYAFGPTYMMKTTFPHFLAISSPSFHPVRPGLSPNRPTKALQVTSNAQTFHPRLLCTALKAVAPLVH